MKKTLIILVGIAVIGIAIWSSLWFVGRSQIEDRLDLEQARAEAQGTIVTWESRTIGGFPFGYEMQASNVAITTRENGMLVRIPKVISRSDASDAGQIETRLIGDISIDLPLPEVQRAAHPELPKVAKLTLAGDNLLATFDGLGQSDRRVAVTADELSLVMDQEDFDGKLDIGASGLNTVLQTAGSKSTFGIVSDALVFNVLGPDQQDQDVSMEVGIVTLSVTATVDTPQTQNLNEILFGGADGSVELVYSTGSMAAETSVSETTGRGGGTFRFASGTGTGILNLQRGAVELRAESRDNVWTVEPKQKDSGISGTVSAHIVQKHYRMPTGPTETPEDAKLRVAVLGLGADETFWNALDPEGVLDRSTSEVLLDLDATARVTGRLDQAGPAQGVPVELANVSLNTLNLKALGGDVHATGDVEVLQPINLPLGGLKIKLSNATAILLSLKQAGLIDEQMRATGAAMLQVYARPGEGEDTWETDLTFDNDGITMNGLRVQ